MFNLMAIPSYISISGVNVALIDLIALVILLIFLIGGVVKGFSQQVLSLLGWFAALIIAFATCEELAKFINKTFPNISESISGWWTDLIGGNFSAVTSKETLEEALKTSSIPTFLHQAIISLVGDEFSDVLNTIVTTLTNWCVIAASFIIIFVLAIIIFAIIKKIVKKIVKLPVLKQLDKVLGAVLGVIKGLSLLFVVAVLFSMFPWFNDLLIPVTESGEAVTCCFNTVFDTIFKLPFIQDLLAGVSFS